MNAMKRALVYFALLIPFSITLTACGGGGGGGSKKPPSSPVATSAASSSSVASPSPIVSSADVSSAASNSSVSVSSSASSSSAQSGLTIRGKVVGSALAGGEVVLSAGSQNITASISNAGEYALNLPSSLASQQTPLIATATGSGAKTWIKLATYLPSAKSMFERAGNDQTLEATELFGVNITPMTTALYAEIINRDSLPTTDAELHQVMKGIQSVRPLENAALLQRLLTDNTFTLPAPATNTLDLLLDENLSETYSGVSDLTQENWVKNYIASALADRAQTTTATNMSGHYFLEARNGSRYLMSFAANGTGELSTGNLDVQYPARNEYAFTAAFSWTQTNNRVQVTFHQPVNYLVETVRTSNDFYSCDITATANIGEECTLQFTAITLDLITAEEHTLFAQVQLRGTAFSGTNQAVRNGVISEHIAALTNLEKLNSVNTNELVDYEWYTGGYRYELAIDGSARITRLVDNITVSTTWTHENNRVTVGETQLWFMNSHIAGYRVAEVIDSRVENTGFIKRTAVNLAESDWIGRWIGEPQDANSFAHDVNADKTWNDGFEANIAGSWRILDQHRQLSVSNNVWRMVRDVLAIHDQKYYMSVCQGEEKENFVPQNCYLTVLTKAENFEGGVFWGNWSFAAFNNISTGSAWVPIGSAIFAGTDPARMTVTDGVRVAANKMFYASTQTILEITAADKNTLEVCEYPLFNICSPSNTKTYARGIQVKLAPGAAALLFYAGNSTQSIYSAQPYFINVFMLPKGIAMRASIFSQTANRQVQTITGCDGTYDGSSYLIPARESDCEISVTFTSNP